MPSATATRPSLRPLSGAKPNLNAEAEAERVLLAWALQHQAREQADADLEAIQSDLRNAPVLIDSGTWEWIRMERDGDDNQRVFDRYLGCFDR